MDRRKLGTELQLTTHRRIRMQNCDGFRCPKFAQDIPFFCVHNRMHDLQDFFAIHREDYVVKMVTLTISSADNESLILARLLDLCYP